ncbi:hypothetical protein MHI57_24925 [Cytobacillus sp. FSL K6-0129]|uniref:hypothetical protein n=1 Tax=Cytobacillus sp. FSL K6-0129 TaxID=2921421 RepID=UPI0030F55228
MAKLTNEQLTEIEQKTESLSVDMPFYTWEASRLLDTDVPALLDMIAELQAEVERKEIMHFKLIEELKKADLYSEKLERKYLSATLETVMDELYQKLRRR